MNYSVHKQGGDIFSRDKFCPAARIFKGRQLILSPTFFSPYVPYVMEIYYRGVAGGHPLPALLVINSSLRAFVLQWAPDKFLPRNCAWLGSAASLKRKNKGEITCRCFEWELFCLCSGDAVHEGSINRSFLALHLIQHNLGQCALKPRLGTHLHLFPSSGTILKGGFPSSTLGNLIDALLLPAPSRSYIYLLQTLHDYFFFT